MGRISRLSKHRIRFICRAEPPGDQRLGFFKRPDWRQICRCFPAASSFPSL